MSASAPEMASQANSSTVNMRHERAMETENPWEKRFCPDFLDSVDHKWGVHQCFCFIFMKVLQKDWMFYLDPWPASLGNSNRKFLSGTVCSGWIFSGGRKLFCSDIFDLTLLLLLLFYYLRDFIFYLIFLFEAFRLNFENNKSAGQHKITNKWLKFVCEYKNRAPSIQSNSVLFCFFISEGRQLAVFMVLGTYIRCPTLIKSSLTCQTPTSPILKILLSE